MESKECKSAVARLSLLVQTGVVVGIVFAANIQYGCFGEGIDQGIKSAVRASATNEAYFRDTQGETPVIFVIGSQDGAMTIGNGGTVNECKLIIHDFLNETYMPSNATTVETVTDARILLGQLSSGVHAIVVYRGPAAIRTKLEKSTHNGMSYLVWRPETQK